MDGFNSLLWPHQSTLTLDLNYALIGDKKVINYTFQLEDYIKFFGGVGVLCHEMFHSLGAPDLYHYSSDGITSVGSWDLMANENNVPQHMNVYMKSHYGSWVSTIPEINEDGRYYLNPITSPDHNCFLIRSPNSYREYFLLEYRKKTTIYEQSLPGEGLLVYRICPYNIGNGFSSSSGGNPIADEIYLFRPGGSLNTDGNIRNAALSEESGRILISDDSDPYLFLFPTGRTNIMIFDIGMCGNTIEFNVRFQEETYESPIILSPFPPEKNPANEVGRDIWKIGTLREIKWGGFNCESVRIDYSIDNGENWEIISPSLPANLGSYLWTVPNTPSMICLVRITDVVNPNTSDVSEVFSIGDWEWVNRITYAELYSVQTLQDNSLMIGGRNGQVYKSNDGGIEWNKIIIPSAQSIFDIYAKNNIIWMLSTYYYSADLIKSTDLGESWIKINIPTFNIIRDIVFLDEYNGYCIGENSTILKTSDSGISWYPKMLGWGNWDLSGSSFLNRNVGWLFTDCIYKTSDGGDSWIRQTPFSYTKMYMDGIFLDESTGFATGTDSEGGWANSKQVIAKTVDGGMNWTNTKYPVNGLLRKIIFVTPQIGFACGDHGAIFKTEDKGSSWELMNSGTTKMLCDIFGREGIVYCVGEGGLILKSSYNYTPPILTKPTSLVAEYISNTGIKLTWDDTSIGEIGYQIEKKENNSGRFYLITCTNENTTEYIDSDIELGSSYIYRIRSYTYDFDGEYSNDVSASITNINEENLPQSFTVYQNFPNPFNPTTIISFDLPKTSKVNLIVYNILGEKILQVDNGIKMAGYHKIEIDGNNITAGVYIYLVEAFPVDGTEAKRDIKKMVLIK